MDMKVLGGSKMKSNAMHIYQGTLGLEFHLVFPLACKKMHREGSDFMGFPMSRDVS